MQVMRFLKMAAAGAALGLASQGGLAAEITGAGATFPYPIYAKWAEAYKAKTGNSLNYQSIGSGGGIRQIQNKTVDFGASDMPLKPEELDKGGLLQFPTFIWVNYLSKVSHEWKEKVGEGTSVNWPAGVGGKGNEGVASYVQRIAGAIGYVEYAYALR